MRQRRAALATPGVWRCFAIDVAGFFPSDDDADSESREGLAPRRLGRHHHHHHLLRSNRTRMAAKSRVASPDGVENGGLERDPAESPQPEG
jgi:hypothetical protein